MRAPIPLSLALSCSRAFSFLSLPQYIVLLPPFLLVFFVSLSLSVALFPLFSYCSPSCLCLMLLLKKGFLRNSRGIFRTNSVVNLGGDCLGDFFGAFLL